MGERRPLGRRRSSGFGRYSSSNHNNNGDLRCRPGRAYGMIVLAALIGGIIFSPYMLFGWRVVLSVSVRNNITRGAR